MKHMSTEEAFIRRKISKQQYNAWRRNIEWSLDTDRVVREVLANPFCQKTGKPLEFWANWTYTFSLDRINSAKGYHHDNVQWVGASVNLAKNILPDDEFVEMCRAVARHHELVMARLNPI